MNMIRALTRGQGMPVDVLKAGSSRQPISFAIGTSSLLYHSMPLPAVFKATAAKCPPRSPLQKILTDTSIHITENINFHLQLIKKVTSFDVCCSTVTLIHFVLKLFKQRTNYYNSHQSITTACNYLSTGMTKICSASQSKFKVSKSNFKVYPPTLERFGTTPQTFEGKQR